MPVRCPPRGEDAGRGASHAASPQFIRVTFSAHPFRNHVKRGEGTGREGCLASLPLADSDREEHARPAARSDGGSFAADTKFAKKQERREAPAAASSDL